MRTISSLESMFELAVLCTIASNTTKSASLALGWQTLALLLAIVSVVNLIRR